MSGGIDIHLVGLQNSMGRQQGIGHIRELRRDGGHECKERGPRAFPKAMEVNLCFTRRQRPLVTSLVLTLGWAPQ